MSTQEALALPSPAPSDTVVISARCSLRIEADQRVIVVARWGDMMMYLPMSLKFQCSLPRVAWDCTTVLDGTLHRR
jgi:hypothetical protein